MDTLTNMWRSWSAGKRWSFIGLAMTVVLGSLLVFWKISNPEYVELPLRFDPAEGRKVVEALDAAKIAFELGEDGTHVRVPRPRVADARAKLASSGLPSGGRVGFETFDETSLGATDFEQRVNLQRALQGELERSLESLLRMEGVRVHLSLGSNRGLLQDRRDAKASVIVPRDHLTSAQIRSIQGVVSGAVEGLASGAVSVVGRDGKALTLGEDFDLNGVLEDPANDRRAHEEERIHRRLVSMLGAFAEPSQIRVSVAVELDPDRVDVHREGPLGTVAVGDKPATVSTLREQRISPPGRVSRISVAIAMPEPAVSRAELEQLIAASAGLHTERGDQLALIYQQWAVEDASHDAPELSPVPPQHIEANPSATDSQRTVGALLIGGTASVSALLLLLAFARRWRRALSQEIPRVDVDVAFERARLWLIHGTR
jgi:flagellar biosynthesis/type III secretory pathway M-ring protein FliF/YscJ